MSEALSLPAAKVIALPTAAPARVRQPEYQARYRALRKSRRAGSVAHFPGQYVSPESRRAMAEAHAEKAERAAIYADGNLCRNGPLMLLSALWMAAPERQRKHALGFLRIAGALADPSAKAALAYALALEGDEPQRKARKASRRPKA